MHPKEINVHVRYVAAPKPFVDPRAKPEETLQSLKSRVLQAFELKEIQDGNQTVLYFLYKEDQKLENLTVTLAQLVGEHHELKLRLVQQIVQGDSVMEVDAKCFSADLAEVLLVDVATRWEISQTGTLDVQVRIASIKEPAERYLACLRWDRYPGNPPSLKFLDSSGSESNPTAWPQCAGFRPTAFDACVNWTREGMALHPEWRGAPATRWDSSGNALFRALNLLQDTLDYQYGGRFRG